MLSVRYVFVAAIMALVPHACTGHEEAAFIQKHSSNVNTWQFDAEHADKARDNFKTLVVQVETNASPLVLKSTTQAAISPDGTLIATGTVLRAEVRALETGKVVTTFDGQGRITALAFSPNSEQLATAGADQSIRIWDVSQRQEIASVECPDHPATRLAFSPDGKQLVSLNAPNYGKPLATGQQLIVWNVAKDANEAFSVRASPPGQLIHMPFAYSPNGDSIVVHNNRKISVRDADTGREKEAFKGISGHLHKLQFSPDGQSVLGTYLHPWAAGDYIKVWNATSGDQELAIPGISGGGPRSDWSPDGKSILVKGKDRKLGALIRVYNAQTGENSSTLLQNEPVKDALFLPGKRVAVAGNGVRILDLATGKELLKLGTGGGSRLVASPDGRFVASIDRNGPDDFTVTVLKGDLIR